MLWLLDNQSENIYTYNVITSITFSSEALSSNWQELFGILIDKLFSFVLFSLLNRISRCSAEQIAGRQIPNEHPGLVTLILKWAPIFPLLTEIYFLFQLYFTEDWFAIIIITIISSIHGFYGLNKRSHKISVIIHIDKLWFSIFEINGAKEIIFSRICFVRELNKLFTQPLESMFECLLIQIRVHQSDQWIVCKIVPLSITCFDNYHHLYTLHMHSFAQLCGKYLVRGALCRLMTIPFSSIQLSVTLFSGANDFETRTNK